MSFFYISKYFRCPREFTLAPFVSIWPKQPEVIRQQVIVCLNFKFTGLLFQLFPFQFPPISSLFIYLVKYISHQIRNSGLPRTLSQVQASSSVVCCHLSLCSAHPTHTFTTHLLHIYPITVYNNQSPVITRDSLHN